MLTARKDVAMMANDLKYIQKIRSHLKDLHEAWQNDPDSDGHCKSNEGWVGYSVSYPNWFEAGDYLKDEPEIYAVQVYSYLFGPRRLHDFDTAKEAWETVKEWKC